ncbi:MAG: glycosyltransferase family 2 protein [bacterium]
MSAAPRVEPFVSVVIPLYDGRRFLAEAIASVRAQTFGDWELVVVDDGSRDGGAELAQAIYPAVRVVRHDANRGLGAARNSGARHARGRYVAYLSADDLWDPEFLERTVASAEREPEAVHFSRYRFIDAERNARFSLVLPVFTDVGSFRERVWEWSEAKNCFVSFSAALFPRSLFDTVPFDEELRFNEDLLFLLQSMYRVPYRLVNAELGSYRLHAEQTTQRVLAEIPAQVERILARAKQELRPAAA